MHQVSLLRIGLLTCTKSHEKWLGMERVVELQMHSNFLIVPSLKVLNSFDVNHSFLVLAMHGWRDARAVYRCLIVLRRSLGLFNSEKTRLFSIK